MAASFDIEFYFTKVLSPIFNYCTEYPVAKRKNLSQIAIYHPKEKITHIQLSWLQAATEFDYQTFESIDPANPNLLLRIHTLQESFRIILQSEIARNPDKNEIERESIPGEIDTNENVIYRIPLMLALKLLNTVLKQEQRSKIIKQYEEINPKNDSLVKVTKTSKATPLIRAALETWVSHLIEINICTSFAQFKTLMTGTYCKKGPMDDEEKYDDGPKVKEVYCLLKKDGKHTVHFKIENDLGVIGSNSKRALSSFKKIFDLVIDRLNKTVT